MEKSYQKKRERTLFLSWTLSAWAPFAIGYSFFLSGAATLFADWFRKTIELLALFLSWFIYRKIISTKKPKKEIYIEKLEKKSSLIVALSMLLSFFVITLNSILQIINPNSGKGDNRLGLLFAIMGSIVNCFFWIRNYSFTKEKKSQLFEAQWKLYRLKTILDFNVIIVLSAGFYIRNQIYISLIDLIGSLFIALFLLISAIKLIKMSHNNTYNIS